MAKKRKDDVQSLSEFPFAVDIFNDNKIKAIKSRFGTTGIMVYIYILCLIYREGFYIKSDDYLCHIIADELKVSPNTVRQIELSLVERAMFDYNLFYSGNVLSSRGIQRRWQDELTEHPPKSKIEVDERYWLLNCEETQPFILVRSFSEKTPEKQDFSLKTEEKCSDKRQKEKKDEKKSNKRKEENKIKKENNNNNNSLKENSKEKFDGFEQPVENSTPPSTIEIFLYLSEITDEVTAKQQAPLFQAYNQAKKWKCLPNWKDYAALWIERTQQYE